MSPTLFESERHETLRGDAWDDARVRATIKAIAADLERRRNGDGSWPVHPLDDEGDTPPGGFKGLYIGRAGVLWALWHLAREGAVTLRGDPAATMQKTYDDYMAQEGGAVVPSYFMGEVGILLALWRMTGSTAAAERIHGAIQANISHPANEAFLGASGTMVAAWHLWQATQEQRWRALFLENVEQLWRTWVFDECTGCHLWTQDLYGWKGEMLGGAHGFAGNIFPLLMGASLIDAERRETLYDRCETALATLARVEGDQVNWPTATVRPRPGRPDLLLQWCHGAPGIVTALRHFPRGRSPAMEDMLTGAGRAIWQAGPLSKGYGICHGTAGNGYAFLELHRRTGDVIWLERARAFAMHAIAQCDAVRQSHEQGRYTLWTGDAGLATYLWCCIEGTAGLPAFDIL